ncbi:MAG: hypothetical protein ACNA71_07650 [Kiritimatiellia bacterium]
MIVNTRSQVVITDCVSPYSQQVRPAHHGIMWPSGEDLSSDTIMWDLTREKRLHAAETPAPHGENGGSTA